MSTDSEQRATGTTDWIQMALPEVGPILGRLRRIESALTQQGRDEYEDQMVSQAWFGTLQSEAVDAGRLPSRESERAILCWATLYQLGGNLNLLTRMLYLRTTMIRRELSWASSMLASRDWNHALVMLRGVLEQVADFEQFLCKADAATFTGHYEEDRQRLITLGTEFVKAVGSTRVDWHQIVKHDGNPAEIRKAKLDMGLAEKDDMIDLRTRGVLSAIDALDKKIHGVRNSYELLCEFLHPNIGNSIGLISAQHIESDRHTMVQFIHRRYSRDATGAALGEIEGLWTGCLARVADAVELFVERREEAQIIRAKLLEHVQVCVRTFLRQNPYMKAPYAPCPCFSGRKVRFCCGKQATG
jgi:hypothetical protein